MSNIIKSVVREHHYSPVEIDALFLDDMDHHGLLYWFFDVEEVNAEMKPKTQTGNKA